MLLATYALTKIRVAFSYFQINFTLAEKRGDPHPLQIPCSLLFSYSARMDFKKKCSRITPQQLDALVTYMEQNSELCEGKLTQNFSKKDRKFKWTELSRMLNSIGSTIKTYQQWQKAWNDQKAYARSKGAKSETLTPIEERILNMIGWVAATGDANIVEAGVPKNKAKPSRAESSQAPPAFETLEEDVPDFQNLPAGLKEIASSAPAGTSILIVECSGADQSTTVPSHSISVPSHSVAVPSVSVPDPDQSTYDPGQTSSDILSSPSIKRRKTNLSDKVRAILTELRVHGQFLRRSTTTQESVANSLESIATSLSSIDNTLKQLANAYDEHS